MERRRPTLQLKRLEILLDVVYGIVIWRLFSLLPKPEGDDLAWASVGGMLADEWLTLLVVAVGLAVVIVYWLQSNLLFGYLEIPDTRHTTFGILQIFFLLLFLYAIVVGVRFEDDPGTRVLESVSAFLVGAASWLGWRHAVRRGDMLAADVTEAEADALSLRTLAEPLTALLTMPFVLVGPIAWELAWLSYPLIAYGLRDRSRRQRAAVPTMRRPDA